MSGPETQEQKGPGTAAALGSGEQHPGWPASQKYLTWSHGTIKTSQYFCIPRRGFLNWVPNQKWKTVFDPQ